MLEQFDSKDEEYFSNWLDELKRESFIKEWERIKNPIPLTQGLTHTWNETVILKTKTKTIPKSQVLLRASEYTPDFGIVWDYSAKDIFFKPIYHRSRLDCPFIADLKDGEHYSIVEIKPTFDYKNMTRGFINNQKYVWDKHGLYINLIVAADLFNETFAPATYFKTPTGLVRKFAKGKPLTFQQYHDKI